MGEGERGQGEKATGGGGKQRGERQNNTKNPGFFPKTQLCSYIGT